MAIRQFENFENRASLSRRCFEDRGFKIKGGARCNLLVRAQPVQSLFQLARGTFEFPAGNKLVDRRTSESEDFLPASIVGGAAGNDPYRREL